MLHIVEEQLKKVPNWQSKKIVIGVSTGIDSMVLLHMI